MKKTKRKLKPAILPANKLDPTGVDRLERGAMRDYAKRLKQISTRYIELLNRIPAEPAVNQRYTFQLDPTLLSMLLQNGDSLVDEILLQGGEFNPWLFQDYVSPSYQRGGAGVFQSVSAVSSIRGRSRQCARSLSDAYQTAGACQSSHVRRDERLVGRR